jgi:uncharacterized membrane protein
VRRPDTLILLTILLVGAALRLYRLNAQSFWVDEFATAHLAVGNGYAVHRLPRNVIIEQPPDLFDLATARPLHRLWYSEVEGHIPPLHLVLTRLWGELFGLGQTSLRTMALLFSLAAIGVLFVVVRDLTGRTAPALWAALLMALAGPQIQYAQEARNYSLLLLEGLGAAAALVRIERHGPSRLREVTLVACVLAIALTHYFTLGAILALVIYAAIRLRGRALRHVIGCLVVVALLWGVLGAPLALRHLKNRDDPRATTFLRDDHRPGHTTRTLMRFTALPVRFIAEPMTTSRAVALAGGVAYVLAPLLALRRRNEMLLWSLWLWLTVLPLLALDLARGTQHLEFVRYTLLASPALYAMLATMLADHAKSWMRHVVPALAALACALALPAAYSAWWKPDWRALGRAIDAHVRPGDLVVFWGYDQGGNLVDDPNSSFYYTSFYRRKPLVGPTVLLVAPPQGPLPLALPKAQRILVVTAGLRDVSAVMPGARVTRLALEPAAGVLWSLEAPPR